LSLSWVTWGIFYGDTFPQIILFSLSYKKKILSGFVIGHPGQRRVPQLVQYNTEGQSALYRRSPENEEEVKHVEEIPLSSEVEAKPLDVIGKQSSNVTVKTEEITTSDGSCGIQCLYNTMQCCASLTL
jgi:hypothetical protein